MRAQAGAQPFTTCSATSNTAQPSPIQMISNPPGVTAPSLLTHAIGQAGTLLPDRGHIPDGGYPSLYPTAPVLPPDFQLRQSWNPSNPLYGSDMQATSPVPGTQAASHAVRRPRSAVADFFQHLVIPHRPQSHAAAYNSFCCCSHTRSAGNAGTVAAAACKPPSAIQRGIRGRVKCVMHA